MGKVKLNKNDAVFATKYFTMLIILAFLRAFSNYIFVNPNGFAPGGLGGLAAIIHFAIQKSNDPKLLALATSLFDPGVLTILMNIPFLIVSFFVLNKRFAFNTTCVVLVYSGFMYLLGRVDCPQYDAEGEYGLMLIAALAGGVLSGTGCGLMFRYNMSMGGTDIIGKVIYKHNPAAHAQYWILLCDCIVATTSGFIGLIGVDQSAGATVIMTKLLSPIFYSFISLFVTSKVSEFLEYGTLASLVFTIITDKPDEIAKEISVKLHRGVTINKAVGYYTGKEHNVLVCVTSKKQINSVKGIVSSCDPNAFMYITKAGEVSGKGFGGNRLEKKRAENAEKAQSSSLEDEIMHPAQDVGLVQEVTTTHDLVGAIKQNPALDVTQDLKANALDNSAGQNTASQDTAGQDGNNEREQAYADQEKDALQEIQEIDAATLD